MGVKGEFPLSRGLLRRRQRVTKELAMLQRYEDQLKREVRRENKQSSQQNVVVLFNKIITIIICDKVAYDREKETKRRITLVWQQEQYLSIS